MKAIVGFAFAFSGLAQSMNKVAKAVEKLSVEMNRLRTHSEAKEFVIVLMGRDSYQNCSLRKKVRLIKKNRIKWQR